jgi:predicted transcriptional regulator
MKRNELKKWLKTYNCSAYRLANESKVSLSTITRFLNGDTKRLQFITMTYIDLAMGRIRRSCRI